MSIDWEPFVGVIGGTTVTREAFVAEARTWIGVPYHHQGDSRLGVDCGGLIKAVLMAVGLLPVDYLSRLPAEARGYARVPDGVLLRAACGVTMTEIAKDALQPGDVVLCRWRHFPQHLGIVGDYPRGALSIIHAENYRKNQVCEQRLWFDGGMKFVAAYQIPGVA